MTAKTWQQLKSVFHSALELKPEERAAFLDRSCDGDHDLRNRVERLLAAHNQSGDFLSSPALVDAGIIAAESYSEGDGAQSRTGERIGLYEIIREIGHGGMGTVFLAVRADDQYRKQVAIKLVNRGMDTDTILRRFAMERQILANLEHPNIAGLFEGGTTTDGLPYFVMEYVEGQPIDDYCDSRGFTIAQRLELFRQVCAALHYAHQNLVVHRDVKPSNILVTAEGVPKLLDFGIAKLLTPDWSRTGEASLSMQRLMTPEYASPEQLRGLPITTGSDVYSLGVVLYKLLTGRHPYRSTSRVPEEMARVILREEPESPSTAAGRQPTDDRKNGEHYEQRSAGDGRLTVKTNPQSAILNPKALRGDLDNIILKALRKEPERRYASVQEFSEDIRRHLEGLPVSASPDTLAYRAGKFIHRHRVSVFAGVFILLLLLAGMTATAWQAHRANRERARAEHRLNETRELSKYLMTDVFDSLTLLSGTAQVQKDLTQNAFRYLDNLAQEESDDVVLLGELAAAYIRLGEVQNDPSVGLQSFQKAVELQRKRISLAPNDAAIKRELAFGLFRVSEVLLMHGATETWLETWNEIQNLQQEFVEAQPNSVSDIFNLAGTYATRGEIFDHWKRRREAESDYGNALLLMTQAINLSKDTAQTPQEKIDLSVKYVSQGEIYTHLEDWQNALANNRTACEIADAVWRENPTLMPALRSTSSSHRRLAASLDKLGDYQGALTNYQYSLRVVSEAAANNRASGEFRRSEAIYTIRVGAALHKVGETTHAIEMVKRGLDLNSKNIAENKNRAYAVRYSFEAFEPATDFYLAIGQREQAIKVYQEWVQIFEELRKNVPREPDFIFWSAYIYAKIGDAHSAFNQDTKNISATNRAKLGDARRWYQKSLDTLGQLGEQRNVSPDIQDLRSPTEGKLAQCETQLNNSLRNDP